MTNPFYDDWQAFKSKTGEYKPRIVVKFRDNNPLRVPYFGYERFDGSSEFNGAEHNYLMKLSGKTWEEANEEYGLGESVSQEQFSYWSETWRSMIEQYWLDLRPTFETKFLDCLQKLVVAAQERATAKHRQYTAPNFFTYFYLETREEGENALRFLQSAVERLNGEGLQFLVETAYIDLPAPDPFTDGELGVRFDNQGHLKLGTDGGVDAKYAWDTLGESGAGKGINLIDLERGWLLKHEDLAHLAVQVIYSNGNIENEYSAHGTAVLGIVCAGLNELGGVGIAPCVSKVSITSYYGRERHNALVAALCEYGGENLRVGDVLLIEAQVETQGPHGDILGPVDAYRADYDLVHLACHLGIIVVEAGGNGTYESDPALDLDHDLRYPIGDSGALIVSAASSSMPHTRLRYAPYGSRVDCYAWGENINTCYWDYTSALNLYQPDDGVDGFSGTSGAAAIIAGVMVVLQGIDRARHVGDPTWEPHDALDWRPVLSNSSMGTSPALGELPIGLMPDLRKIIDNWPF